jgi:hypothetical protein
MAPSDDGRALLATRDAFTHRGAMSALAERALRLVDPIASLARHELPHDALRDGFGESADQGF